MGYTDLRDQHDQLCTVHLLTFFPSQHGKYVYFGWRHVGTREGHHEVNSSKAGHDSPMVETDCIHVGPKVISRDALGR